MSAHLDLPALRRLLLDLLAPDERARLACARLAEHDDASLAALEAIVAEHRIAPMLHYGHRGDPALPARLAERWKQAHRQSALESLAFGAELRQVCALLEGAGLAPIALKGAWLAWHAYPEPALRPMRDIDLLLDAETAIPAFELLQRHGYVAGEQDLSLADKLRLDKHMPALRSPREVWIELHHRLWEVDGRMDHAAPAGLGADPRGRAIRENGIACLAPTDCLAHLVIHAVYDHRLDCGPLLLTDVAFLTARHAIDWDAFWAEARAGGWDRGARLVLDLVAAHDPEAPLRFPADLPAAPAALVAAAPDLLLQQLDTRQSAGVLATARAAGPVRFLNRISARRGRAGEVELVSRDLSAEGGWFGWASRRLARTFGQLAQHDVRRQSSNLARLSRWLDS